MKKAKNYIAAQENSLPFDISEFFGKATIEKAAELYERLQEPVIKSGETKISARNLHYWVNTLGINDRQGNEKHKFTFTEFVWLKMIEHLREAGLNLSVISLLHKNLFSPIPLKEFTEFLAKEEQAKKIIDKLKIPKEEKEKLRALIASPEIKAASENIKLLLLDMLIVESIIKREPISLAVFLDGNFIPLYPNFQDKYPSEIIEPLFFETYVSVSISGIIKNFLRSDLSEYLVPKLGLLGKAENTLFEYIQSGEYQSITIHFSDKKIKSLELKKSENIKDKIIDLMNKSEFGEVVIKKHKGQIVRIENTTKVTL